MKVLTKKMIDKLEELEKINDDLVDWDELSSYYKLEEDFIERHINQLSMYTISYYQELSEEFIERHSKEISFHNLFRSQKLSKEFIKKYSNHVDFKSILYSKHLDNYSYEQQDMILYNLLDHIKQFSGNLTDYMLEQYRKYEIML